MRNQTGAARCPLEREEASIRIEMLRGSRLAARGRRFAFPSSSLPVRVPRHPPYCPLRPRVQNAGQLHAEREMVLLNIVSQGNCTRKLLEPCVSSNTVQGLRKMSGIFPFDVTSPCVLRRRPTCGALARNPLHWACKTSRRLHLSCRMSEIVQRTC